jgi:hypothetical protein
VKIPTPNRIPPFCFPQVGTIGAEHLRTRLLALIEAAAPDGQPGDCEIAFPLPPQIISLADLSVSMADKPSENVLLCDGKLIWRAALPAQRTQFKTQYTAVGKGLYDLSLAAGGLVDRYKVLLTANGSDVRLLELSLQPTSFDHTAGSSTYQWDYSRLVFGRPVRVDVLGIAPIDRLGELRWLGPLSVVIFGLLIGLVVQAAAVPQFDRWTLLLTVGTFAAAYPLMYFAQEYVSLFVAMLVSGGLAIVIISIRAITLMPLLRAVFGILMPAVTIMAITLCAAVWPQLQGVLLTLLGLGFFVAAMMLMPKVAAADNNFWALTSGRLPASNAP